MKYLFYNGNILSPERKEPQQAMLVSEDIIRFVGSERDALEFAGNAEIIDLQGKTLLPSFIDAHSHLSAYAISFLQAKLNTAESFEDIVSQLKAFYGENSLENGDWLVANSYDHNKLKEQRHPSREILDKEFPEIKVVLQHQSGHFGVFNSAALKAVGLTGSDEDGYLEEGLFVEAVKKVPLSEPNQLLKAYSRAMQSYAAYGITTAQEGMMIAQMLPLYKLLLKNRALKIDVVGYPQIEEAELLYKEFSDNEKGYSTNFRLGGCKIILDGSPQGKTAWMKTPYLGTTDNYGISSMSNEAVSSALKTAVKNKWQLLAHCNGDAAIEQYLTCMEKMEEQEAFAALRPVIIHAQLIQHAQLFRAKQLGLLPSFFSAHCYYWGDVHIANFGKKRAEKISPANSALKLGIVFTLHQDAPVIEPNMLETVWCAVNRITKNGEVLGREEGITVREALKAITCNAAYQYGEERSKGTLDVGKRADFVILDRNPLMVQKQEIKDIQVLQTFKDGKCIYKR